MAVVYARTRSGAASFVPKKKVVPLKKNEKKEQ